MGSSYSTIVIDSPCALIIIVIKVIFLDMAFSEIDTFFMRRALELGRGAKGRTFPNPAVGAVVVGVDGKIIGEGATGMYGGPHAEKTALAKAKEAARGATLYVTLEPCPMCAGAIVNSRIRRVIFGAHDPKSGAFGSVFDMNSFSLNHKPEIIPGVLESECSKELSSFFARLREKKNT